MEQLADNIGATLLAFHSVITRGLWVALENCAAFAAGEAVAGTLEGLSDYTRTLAAVIDSHHLVENDIMFPYLEPLLPDIPFERLRADHRELVPKLHALSDASARWKEGQEAALDEMEQLLAGIDAIWHPHIQIEEVGYAPDRLAALVTAEEHTRLIAEAVALSQASMEEPFLYVPFLIYNATSEYRPIITKPMPDELLQKLVPVVWKDQWEPMRPFLLV